MSRTTAGFTIIELMVSLSTLAVLAALLFPMAEHALRRQKESDLRQALSDIRTALDDYRRAVIDGRVPRTTESGFPASLAALVETKNDNGAPFLRAIPRDPFATDVRRPATATWKYRAYQSPPDAPAPGPDIFDIYSGSRKTGTNGVPYMDW